jgi:hypothetical protein
MTTIKAFVKRNPVLTYFIITFAISWGAVLIMIGYNGMPTTREQLDAQLPVAILAMLGGPSIAGLLMMGLVNGRAGFRNLLSRLLKWRVSFCWYAVALLTTGLIVGVIWGAWHILSNDVWAIRTYSGALSPALFVTLRGFGFLIGQLPPFRILMVWVYDRTGSLLVAMLMHVGLTASTLILGPLAELGVSVLIYDLALAVAMWLVAAAVVAANRGQLSRQAL